MTDNFLICRLKTIDGKKCLVVEFEPDTDIENIKEIAKAMAEAAVNKIDNMLHNNNGEQYHGRSGRA